MNKPIWLSIMLCIALLQLSCAERGDNAAVSASSPASATALKVSTTPGLSAKPGLPVSLQTPRQQIPVADPTKVDLTLLTQQHSGRYRVRLSPSLGLSIISGEPEQLFTLDDTGRVPLSLVVQADRVGKYYLNIEVVNPEQTEGINRRALAAVILVGNDAVKPSVNGPLNSQKKRVLPAQESIR